MKLGRDVEIAVIGTGFAGIAVAYYLCTEYQKKSVLLIDSRQPMSYTSAKSGDNYRNWFPHPIMVDFINYSTDLMERIALESPDVMQMTRRGYALTTRRTDIDDLIAGLHAGYGDAESDLIRIHSGPSSNSYQPIDAADWTAAPNGVDVMSKQDLIRRTFPSFSPEVAHVLHIRRAGAIDGQQMGQYMLQRIKQSGGKRLSAHVRSIGQQQRFELEVEGPDGIEQINADVIVNAAGPFADEIAAMIGVDLPLKNVYQQKLAFDDQHGAISRQLPFSLDLDDQELNWTDEERDLLADDPDMAWLLKPILGGAHCRPDGGDKRTWVKLGWAFNRESSEPQQELANDPHFNPNFPELILRATARLNPSLQRYSETFPSSSTHYGGYYPMTNENWPLIGPLGVDGAFVIGALSGYGCMAACAAGAICAAWITDGNLPDYATQLSLARYDDEKLMTEILNSPSKGIL